MSSDRRDDRGRARDSRDDRKGRHHDTNKNDPKSLRCRVFVGNLNTDNLSRQEFEDIFSKHGHVTGCSIHNGFGFVQYEKEGEADLAVQKEHGSIIKNKRVDVNLAGDRRKPDDNDKRRGPPGRGRGGGRPGDFERPRDRSPSPPARRGPPGFRERESFRGEPLAQDPLDQGDPLESSLKRGPYAPPRDGYRRPDDPYSRGDPYSNRPPLDALPPKRMRPDYDYPPPSSKEPVPYRKPVDAPIDCEIIIINKQQRGYAELVEKKLKSHGVVVECAHLPETVTLTDELEDACRRGVLYGIIISSQHEVHHSVTVHILHGTQQEHRNMPLEDAINLVSRNFDMYMQNLRERERDREREYSVSVEPVEASKGYGAGNPPGPSVTYSPEIAQLLNMAADGKSLTANQYAQLINEFTKLRDDLLRKEGRPLPSSGTTSKPFPTDPQSIALQQAELQAKILSILNPSNKTKSTADNNTTAPKDSQVNSSPGPEAKPATKIPVLTPSYGASAAFKAPVSTVPSQAGLPQTRAANGTEYTSKIIGMALSNIRNATGQNAVTSQGPSSTSYPQSSTSYPPTSTSYPQSSLYSSSGPSTARSVQPKTWSQAQFRVPTVTTASSVARAIPSTAQSYGVTGQFKNTANAGYRSGVPNSYRRY